MMLSTCSATAAPPLSLLSCSATIACGRGAGHTEEKATTTPCSWGRLLQGAFHDLMFLTICAHTACVCVRARVRVHARVCVVCMHGHMWRERVCGFLRTVKTFWFLSGCPEVSGTNFPLEYSQDCCRD